MYRVVVKNRDNVVLHIQYRFTKWGVARTVARFNSYNCECRVEKFICWTGITFDWSEEDVGHKVWEKIDRELDKWRKA